MDRALIIGSAGQDGRLLSERLAREGCAVVGVERDRIVGSRSAGLASEAPVDILDPLSVGGLIGSFSPDAIFYLAAYHHSAEDKLLPDDLELYVRSHDVHVRGLLHVLEAVRKHAPQSRLFYAASSHCFGEPPTPIQDESTPLRPRCAYGITKTAGVGLCRMYRANHSVHASAGFFYNHESAFRARKFLSTKIVRAAVEISRGRRDKLVLGDLAARVDWGFAPDYVDAVIRIVGLETADDFVIATGESHSVEEFVAAAFSRVRLDWRRYVEVEPAIIGKPRTALVGDSTKLRTATGWSPSVTFQQMVELLVDAELQRPSKEALIDV
jgi:GDPmannose 4,6-dehydratase